MFLDKRDKKGQFLSFSSFSLSNKIAELCLNRFVKTEIYKELINFFPAQLVSLLFKKKFYESVYPTSCKIVLANYNKEKKIETSFDFINLLQGFENIKDLKFIQKKEKINKLSIIKKLKNLIWINYDLISSFLKLFNYKKKENDPKKNDYKIGVNYLEGIDLQNRSDFFWYDKNLISNKVLTYFENSKRIEKNNKRKKKLFFELKSLNIQYKFLYNSKYFLKNKNFDLIRKNIRNLKVKGDEKIFKKYALIFISKIQYTYNFFKKNKIKIHYNTEEMGTSNIIRQIAIKLYDGCSIGRTKSYPTMIEGDFIGFFPNDIFFAWGKETARRISQTENLISNILITGDHYPKISKSDKKIYKEKINKLKKNNVKFFILVLDSSYSENKNFTWQLTYKKNMEIFFENILHLQENNPDIGLIIKSKKKNNLADLKNIFNKIKLLDKNNRCIFINENNKLASHFSEFADLTISMSPYIQGALFHCLINSKNLRGVIYDDSNLTSIEKEIYKVGEDKIIFRDLRKMLNKLIDFKNDPKKNYDFGKWNDLFNHDPFMDGEGGKRVGLFLNDLINFYNEGLDSSAAITKAIKRYSDNHGKDKVHG